MVLLYCVLIGLSYGMVLFLLSAGVSIVFGLMDVVNLAHGMMFMTSAFLGITVSQKTGSFLLGLAAGILAAGVLGLILERGFLRTLYGQQLSQILVCFGFIYIVTNIHLWVYGPFPKVLTPPESLTASIPVGAHGFSLYRIMIVVVGLVICGLLYWAQERTKVGAIIRAGMEKPRMVYALGINLMAVNVGAFVIGACLSGLAGFIGVPILGGVNHSTGGDIVFVAMAVVIVGGVGSVQGTLVGALLIGIGTSVAQTFLPLLAPYMMYVLMALVMIVRPTGLLGRKT
jgi:branched-chain amino acid transport system permease protein